MTGPFLHHCIYEFRAGLRDKSLLLLNYLFPLLFFALVSALMGGVNPGFRATMIPAMTVFAVMCSYLLGFPPSIVAARESGLYRSFRISGVPDWAGPAAPILGNAVHMAVVTAVIAVAGVLVFDAAAPADPLRFAAGWLCLVASTAGFGLLVSVTASNSRAASLMAQVIYIPSILLGGLMTPPDILPPVLARAALLFPATHAMRIFRGDGGWPLSAAVLIAGAIVAVLCAGALYEWDPKNARPERRKLLALAALAPGAITMLL